MRDKSLYGPVAARTQPTPPDKMAEALAALLACRPSQMPPSVGTVQAVLMWRDAIAAANEALAAYEAEKAQPAPVVPAWQSIETAPKGGVLVDILCDGRRYAGCHYDRICDEFRHITACGVLVHLKKASHWMAVPAAPQPLPPAPDIDAQKSANLRDNAASHQRIEVAQQERQPLTKAYALALWGHRSDGPDNHEIITYARAVEAFHGITGEQHG